MQPDGYRAWGLLADAQRRAGAEASKVREAYAKAIALAAEPLKQTPRDEFLLADVGSYHAALGREKQALPLLAQAQALAPDVPQVLYQVAIGYEALGRREQALRCLARAQASGYAAASVARDPRLAELRKDPRYRASAGEPGISDPAERR
jgi:tetratricopeptide (TPR) repeat protein